MSDNVTLNAGSGGDTVAADDVGGVKFQRVKLNFGADGSATDVSAAAPLPVSDADVLAAIEALGPLTDAQLRAAAIAISAAALPLPTGAAAETTLAGLSAKLPATIGQKAKAAALAVTLASDEDILARIGEVQASPTANTLLDRLKAIAAAASAPALAAGENHVGQVGGHTPRVTGQLVRPGDTTQYALGDLVGNSQTAASVVPITFANAARISEGSGRITAVRCVVTAASGTIVLPKFDLILFRPAANIPFTAGSYPADNAALNVSAAAMKEIVGIFSFSDTAWRNQAGGATAAGDHVYQAATISSGRLHAPFNLASLGSSSLLGLLQAQNTWNPGNVQNTFDFLLDVDQD